MINILSTPHPHPPFPWEPDSPESKRKRKGYDDITKRVSAIVGHGTSDNVTEPKVLFFHPPPQISPGCNKRHYNTSFPRFPPWFVKRRLNTRSKISTECINMHYKRCSQISPRMYQVHLNTCSQISPKRIKVHYCSQIANVPRFPQDVLGDIMTHVPKFP